MQNQYCNPLKFNCKILANEKFLEFCKSKYMNIMNYKSFLHTEFIELLESKGIIPSHIESFYSPEKFIMGIHKDDADSGDDITKINFIWGGIGSLMHWYDIKDSSVPVYSSKTDIGTVVNFYPDENYTLVSSLPVHSPSLVQVGKFHNITNPNEKRLCISVVIRDKQGNAITMNQALQIFSEYLI